MAYTTINKSTDYFNTKLYTGNGGTQSITGVGFQPDWSWFKKRNSTADSSLMDAVRGVRKSLTSNNTEVEYTESAGLSAFDSDGFSFDGAGFDHVNTNGDTFASWNWLGANGTTANTDGTISSTVSANTTSGFSIVSYSGNSTTGATVGHGLSTAPKMIIIKSLGVENMWEVYHESLGNTKGIYLNGTDASFTTSARWNNTSPTSSVWTMGNTTAVNGNGINYIAYCFADVQGFSKMGSYTGNGNADGTFVYTGFKPAFVIIKPTSITGDWRMHDNKRNPHNVLTQTLKPNSAGADDATASGILDYTSNGFKWRTNSTYSNGSGVSFIYMAFAEAPLVGTNGVTAKAR